MAAMQMSNVNGTKVYALSGGKDVNPLFLTEAKKRALRKDENHRRRVELIQDFTFPTSCKQLTMTADGDHILAIGTYRPLLRCFTTSDMSLKFERGLDAEPVALQSLSDDYGKLVVLGVDRTLEFHAPYGRHHVLRVPRFGRCMTYRWADCDLLIGGAGDEVYRLNLERGSFKAPLTLDFDGCNAMALHSGHPLLATGGGAASVAFFDMRSRSKVAALDVTDSSTSSARSGKQGPGSGIEVTSLSFDSCDNVSLAVGTSDARVVLFDIRSSRPLLTKEHQYGLPIIQADFVSGGRILSADRKIIKFWHRPNAWQSEDDSMGEAHDHPAFSLGAEARGGNNPVESGHGGDGGPAGGAVICNIEPAAHINSIHLVKDARSGNSTGLLMAGGEQEEVASTNMWLYPFVHFRHLFRLATLLLYTLVSCSSYLKNDMTHLQ
jgi:ribosome biogenesis protein ENP2